MWCFQIAFFATEPLGIVEGRIVAAIHPAQTAPDAAETLDVGDDLVLPGLVDTHVHCLSSPNEGIARATAAAAAGGVTTVVDMPYDAGPPVFDRDSHSPYEGLELVGRTRAT